MKDSKHKAMGNPNLTDDHIFYAGILVGDECVCGGSKSEGKAFCYTCWKELPNELQLGLYKQLDGGFEEGYEQAEKWLRENYL